MIMMHPIRQLLAEKGLEDLNPNTPNLTQTESVLTELLFGALGLNPSDPNLSGTPRRLAKMYCEELLKGLDYNNFPDCTTFPNPEGGYDEIILVRDIEVQSLCAHHFVPIIGRAHIGYIPSNDLLGLSKFNRVVEFFSRRPQLQERLTKQVQVTLSHILGTPNVGIVIEADHLCVRYRGVQDPCSDTVTSAMSGVFRERPEARSELLALINMKGSKQ